ncbi:hypothetical protein C491_01761 [Natronococcus amylolyticus DSM 10524]|uniref:DUF1102 domain-containing protein n=1 Tax=Natronococcus amylolyticus DSM 10524 TaxID=1227497 RepID=L9XHR8_9EURY|nr:hypothetical protein [Natronococcus amylolyticus]ELY60951.1 hypothetical protein C491_01761 [Natronococcus amylolyticus DSM 10524]
MKLNRRNTLIGLGTIVAGGGAALGTGAFSTVEAGRDVNIETDGDGAALLELRIESETLSGDEDDNDVIEFDLDNLNEDATTRFNDALAIGYNGDEDDVTYSIDIEDEDENEGQDLLDVDGEAMYFEGDEPFEVTGSDGGDEISLDVVFDLRENDESDIPEEIIITATDDSSD